MSLRSVIFGLLQKSQRNSSASTDEAVVEKRRSTRVNVDSLDAVKLNIRVPEDSNTASVWSAEVENVSLRGCRVSLLDGKNASFFKEGQVYESSLDVHGFSIPLKVQVIRVVSDQELALSFGAPFPRELSLLQRFLEPRCLGLSLKEINAEHLQNQAQKNMRWYQGINDTNFFTWRESEKGPVTMQQIIFLDKVVECSPKNPVKTGDVDVARSQPGVKWAQSDLLKFHSTIDFELLEDAKTIVSHSLIDESLKQEFFKNCEHV